MSPYYKRKMDALSSSTGCEDERLWLVPDEEQLKQEYYREYVLKPGVRAIFGDPFPMVEDFLRAARSARPVVLTREMDMSVRNRTRTETFDELHDLIKGYQSYGTFRTEDTLKNLYDRLLRCKPLYMPIILHNSARDPYVMAGNTRLDVAFQLGVSPRTLFVDTEKAKQLSRSDRTAAIERKMSHWVRRVMYSALLNSMGTKDNGMILLGGIIALEYYLQGEALEQWHASKHFMPPVVYYCGRDAPVQYGNKLARAMNEEARSPHRADQLMIGFKKSGIQVSNDRFRNALNQNKLFVFAGNSLSMDLEQFSSVATRVIIAKVVSVSANNKRPDPLMQLMCDKKYMAEKSGHTLVKHPILDAPIVPFGHVISDTRTTTRASREFLMHRFLEGSTMLHTARDDTLEKQILPYHFALKTIRDAFRRNPEFIDTSRWGSFRSQVLKEVTTYKPHRRSAAGVNISPLPVQLVNMVNLELSMSLSFYIYLKEQSHEQVTNDRSRYSKETARFGEFINSNEMNRSPFRKALKDYTLNSTQFNQPLIKSSLTSEPITNARTIRCIQDLNSLFEETMHRNVLGEEREDMYLYRGHDLIELTEEGNTASLYNNALPFLITSKAFTSVSAEFVMGENFRAMQTYNVTPCCLMRIRVPPDYKYYIPVRQASRFKNEEEVLFPVGTVFLVHGRKYLRRPNTLSQMMLLDCTVGRHDDDREENNAALARRWQGEENNAALARRWQGEENNAALARRRQRV